MQNRTLIKKLYQGFLLREPDAESLDYWDGKLSGDFSLEQFLDALLNSDEFARKSKQASQLFVAPGHFYSPIVNTEEVQASFPPDCSVDSLPGISISRSEHLQRWNEFLPYLKEIPFPEEKSKEYRYYFNNPAYSYGDGSILHAMLRLHKPKQLVEVGSGFSSACSIDTIDNYLAGETKVSFVEPYPELLLSLLGEDAENRYQIHACTVQQADSKVFEALDDGDFLFIDSTHVMKTGSDVCHELFNILPRLKSGVFIHFHDIFWPFEYGRHWVVKENRSWNEIYGLRSFLMFNPQFKIEFFNDFFVRQYREQIQQTYPQMLKNTGGSIWLRKT